MAGWSTQESFLADIADAIRQVEGSTEPIPATEYAAHIRKMKAASGGAGVPLDPVEVYHNTRPADWLPMPEPNEDEMYLLFHVPDGVSALLAFTVTCTGSYTVALGTVSDGQFVEQTSLSLASGTKYETEIFADDFGELTSNGMKQIMVKVNGTNISTWESSTHSKKTAPANFSNWNMVEITCNLPKSTAVKVANQTALKYYTQYGRNNITDMNFMFSDCQSLTVVPVLDTRQVTNMSYMFNSCFSLTTIPALDTAQVISMEGMFSMCSTLTTVPALNTAQVTTMASMFNFCLSLTVLPALDTTRVTNMSNIFNYCNKLNKVQFHSTVVNWAGYDISLKDCALGRKALVLLFNSLPDITSSKKLTITGNPGVAELTAKERRIALDKYWNLVT